MRTKEQIEAYYEQLANDYVGQAIIGRYRASVHLENQADEWFWNQMLQKYGAGKYNFIFHSRTPEGQEGSGCRQCLAFRNYLSEKFFICIDSDYRCLKQERDIDAAHFILQTYTYSWENHCCHAEGLQEPYRKALKEGKSAFDFNSFLAEYSKAIYKPLILFLYMAREKQPGFSQKQFNSILSLQYKKDDLNNNGSNVIVRLQDAIDKTLEKIGKQCDFEAEKSYYKNLGLNEANAYLRVRGHNLYNLVLSIGNQLVNDFETSILCSGLDFDCYGEIIQVARDIQTIGR